MSFTPQTYSVGQVLTAAQMNQVDDNIDNVRNRHFGTATPGSLVGGVSWLDTNSTPVVFDKLYTATAFVTKGLLHVTSGHYGHISGDISSFNAIRVGSGGVFNRTISAPVASGQFAVIVPDANIQAGDIWEIMMFGTGADGREAVAIGCYRSGGTPTVADLLTDATLDIGYTANSGFWGRNLTASQNLNAAALLRRAS